MSVRLTSIAMLALSLPAIAGDITGQILITRRLSKKTVSPTIYNLRGTAPSAMPSSADPVNEFDSTVVILEGGHGTPAIPQTLTIEQRDSRFEPELVVVPVGSTVQFPNSDPIFHNVFSLSRAQSFDLGYYAKSQSRNVKFPREGVVQVYCHIHSNMYAAIVVTGSPWYGHPSATGAFSFTGVPAGHYRAVAWHKIAGLYEVPLDVPESGSVAVQIRVPVDVEPVR
jgi:plastocyanin